MIRSLPPLALKEGVGGKVKKFKIEGGEYMKTQKKVYYD
jgi:hypothetical protein